MRAHVVHPEGGDAVGDDSVREVGQAGRRLLRVRVSVGVRVWVRVSDSVAPVEQAMNTILSPNLVRVRVGVSVRVSVCVCVCVCVRL